MSTESGEQVVIDTYQTTVHTLGRQNGKEGRRLRYMQKDGRFPVVFQKAPGEWSPYLMDIFTTLVEIRWRVMLLVFSLSYILSWLFFGLCYWLIAYVHGDVGDVDINPCVHNVRGFTGAFLFSMETQATIGYGFRGMTENCMVAIIVVTIQDVFSCLLDTIVIGIVVAKMASARKRAQTVGFSSCAVVNLRDGVLCLSWRLGDFRVLLKRVMAEFTAPDGKLRERNKKSSEDKREEVCISGAYGTYYNKKTADLRCEDQQPTSLMRSKPAVREE
ncbi:inward rectifier potassium channel 16-like protein [Lates japonicus]|uniref:Inward rectifier potassium channel 16-like protein n=1 Tax=Lates japonicus TaxID=270547 RepID=A0AAD3QYR8_LATJO|nr:inward rectifier potassium channel 16-like protein [Lates japonicus]